MIDAINEEIVLFDENDPFLNQLNLFNDQNILDFNKECNLFQDELSNNEDSIQMEKENEKIETNLNSNFDGNQSKSVSNEKTENLKNILCPSKQNHNIIISKVSKNKSIEKELQISKRQENYFVHNENKSCILENKENSSFKFNKESKNSIEKQSLKNKISFKNIEKNIFHTKILEINKRKTQFYPNTKENEINFTSIPKNDENIKIIQKKQKIIDTKIFSPKSIHKDENKIILGPKKERNEDAHTSLENKDEKEKIINLIFNKKMKFPKEEDDDSPKKYIKDIQKKERIKPMEKKIHEKNNPKSFYIGNVNLNSTIALPKQEIEEFKTSDNSFLINSKIFKNLFNKEKSYDELNHEINKKNDEKQKKENINSKIINSTTLFLKNKEPLIKSQIKENNENEIQLGNISCVFK